MESSGSLPLHILFDACDQAGGDTFSPPVTIYDQALDLPQPVPLKKLSRDITQQGVSSDSNQYHAVFIKQEPVDCRQLAPQLPGIPTGSFDQPADTGIISSIPPDGNRFHVNSCHFHILSKDKNQQDFYDTHYKKYGIKNI
jgi:hypothetical protein